VLHCFLEFMKNYAILNKLWNEIHVFQYLFLQWQSSIKSFKRIWNAAHGGCDRSAGDAHSSTAPDPTFAFVGSPCCPTLDFVMITFYTLLTSLFCILYKNWTVISISPATQYVVFFYKLTYVAISQDIGVTCMYQWLTVPYPTP
jgi:hypothetical protein